VNSAPDLTPSLPSFNRAKPPEDTAQKEKDDIQVENSVETHKAPGEVSRFKLIAFQAGVFFAQMPASNPSLNNTMENIRAITVAWTPTIPVPFIPFLSFRGNVGGSFALQGSLNNNFLVKELQLFLTFTLLDLLYVEGGAGKQFWQGYRTFSGPLHSVNAGLLFRIGLIDRIFIGYQSLDTSPRFNQYKAGIGMSF
jgi:hypothetical protein